MSVLTAQFSSGVNQNPHERKDYLLKVVETKDGGEETIEKLVDYTKIQESNGTIEMWDYATMKKAGVDMKKATPKTGSSTKLDGFTQVMDAANEAIEEIQANAETKNENKK